MNDKDTKIGLIISCPITGNLDKPHNENCPLNNLRKLELKKRVDAWKSMSKEEINDIVTQHRICLCEYESKYRKNLTEFI